MSASTDRNIVLLCLDSVREDYFRRFGQRLSDRADVVYTQCRAASGWSVPSHATMFTGELPHEHGIHVYNRDFSSLKRYDTVLGALPNYHAFGVSANAYATSTFGFDGIFDEYTDISPHRRFPNGLDVMQFGQTHDKSGLAKHVEFLKRALSHPHPLQSLGNGAFRQIDEVLARLPIPKPFDDGASMVCREVRRGVRNATEPFFAFANLMDAHGPHHPIWAFDRELYSADPGWSSAVYSSHEINEAEDLDPYEADLRKTREIYGASIEYLDRMVDSLIDDIRSLSDRPTTVVVTADHGENLGFESDRGFVAHKGSLSEGLLHVPLIVLHESSSDEGTVDARYVSHCSLPDLLIGLADGAFPDISTEHPLAERVGSNLPDHVDRSSETGRYWDRAIRVCYEDERKFQWNSLGSQQTYAIDFDRPNWQAPVDEAFDAERLDEQFFGGSIEAYDRAAREAMRAPDLDAATEQRLADLGYR